jgi:uncharacterized protein YjbI with pentapeptide repeats
MTRNELLAAYKEGKRNFCGADLRGADLRGADLGSADLRGADLRGANLGGANLGGANLGGAHLGGAHLGGANLGSANLRGANLGSANLRGANLRGANLGGANLGDQWIVQGATRSDGYQFMLTNFKSEGVRLKAGCRNFTMPEAYEHWMCLAALGGRGGTPLGDETIDILDSLWTLAWRRGYLDQEGKWINEHA